MSIAKKPPVPPVKSITFGEQTLDINYFLTHEYTDVSEAANELPQAVEWLNQMLQYYISQELVDYHGVKEAEAKAYFELRGGQFAIQYGDKMTEKALEYAVEANAQVKEAVALHADAKAWISRVRIQIDLLLHRMEMIRTVEATRRHADESSIR